MSYMSELHILAQDVLGLCQQDMSLMDAVEIISSENFLTKAEENVIASYALRELPELSMTQVRGPRRGCLC